MERIEAKDTWPFTVLRSVELVDENTLISEHSAVKDTETVVGEVPLLYRKMDTLAYTYKEMSDRTMLDAKYCRDKEKATALKETAATYSSRSEVLKEMFWTGLREIYPESNGKTIGVRDGHKVVVFDSESSGPTGLLDMLKRFRGEQEDGE